MRLAIRALVLVFVMAGPAVAGPITVQYDTGDTSNLVDLDSLSLGGNGFAGNLFTGLPMGPKTITRVTAYFSDINTSHNVKIAQPPTFGNTIYQGNIDPPVNNALNVHVLSTPVSFSATSVMVGFQAFSGFSLALDPDTSAGSHARTVPQVGSPMSLTGNFVVRMTGPAGLPVELVDFEIE